MGETKKWQVGGSTGEEESEEWKEIAEWWTAATRVKYAYTAKLAEQAERYEEMADSMKQLARLDIELTPEERNLLGVGYKKVIVAKRDSWRILSSLEKEEEANGMERNVRRIRGYRKRIEDEISKICNEVLSITDSHLLSSLATAESLAFFYKMKGDYYRYLAEFRTGDERKEAVDEAQRAYQAGTSTATTDLPSTHPVRLGLALNFSVFYYEIIGSTERACQLAKQAYDEAMTEVCALSEESYQEFLKVDDEPYKDSKTIMSLIKDNLILWTADVSEEAVYGLLDRPSKLELLSWRQNTSYSQIFLTEPLARFI